MYYALSILTGGLIALAVVMNGGLTARYGVYPATVMIHAVGLVLILVINLRERVRLLPDRGVPAYYYLGGVIGVGTVVFNNVAFSRISVSALLALSLLGQSVTSIVVDQFGLFRMRRVGFNWKKLVGIAFIVLGIVAIMAL